jgi:hypothetical protein
MIRSFNAKAAVLTSVDVLPSGDGVLELGRATLTVELSG